LGAIDKTCVPLVYRFCVPNPQNCQHLLNFKGNCMLSGSGGRGRKYHIYYLNTIFKSRALVFLCTESVPELCTE